MGNKQIIITASDRRHGDFLVGHWLRSLKDNVRLDSTDVAVIDYGLSAYQRNLLDDTGIIRIAGKSDGHVVTSRFIDTGRYLASTEHDQVLFIDSADIIIQSDISRVFTTHCDDFRVAGVDMEIMFFEQFIGTNFNRVTRKKLWSELKDKPVLNAGVIFAPRLKFIRLCRMVGRLVGNRSVYGPDQVAVNYFLYRERFKFLDHTYNFMPGTEQENFSIRDGVFYHADGRKVAVVHNAGHVKVLRPIANFGYGTSHNIMNHEAYYGKRAFFALAGIVKGFFRKLKRPEISPLTVAYRPPGVRDRYGSGK